jgi:hypothetical protein
MEDNIAALLLFDYQITDYFKETGTNWQIDSDDNNVTRFQADRTVDKT